MTLHPKMETYPSLNNRVTVRSWSSLDGEVVATVSEFDEVTTWNTRNWNSIDSIRLMSPLDGSDWGRSAISGQGANIFLGIWGKQVFSIDLKTGKVRWVNNQLRFMERLQVSS
jgi:hypothetical protein